MKAIVSPQSRIRLPDDFVIGDDSIVDDYCYFSTKVCIGRSSHVASGCTIAGGPARTFRMGDFSSLSAGVRIWCTSDDFTNDLVTIIPADCEQIKTHLISGDVELGNYTAVGANSVVMPNNTLPEGSVIGALSFVPAKFAFDSWSVYAGIPLRFVRPRNRENVIRQVERLEQVLASRGARC
jgi:acetyltransferase-like isoleucine patch superfamily enzyme